MKRTGHRESRRPRRSSTLRGLAPAVEAFEPRCLLSTILFDPDGTGSGAPTEVNEFGNATGNALAIGSEALINQLRTATGTGTTAPFFTVYHARIQTINLPTGPPVFLPGLNTNYMTVLVGFWEQATITGPNSVTFSSAGVPQTGSFFEIYSEVSPGTGTTPANDDTGLGFRDGTLILKGVAIPGALAGQFATEGGTAPALDNNSGGVDATDPATSPDRVPSIIGGGGTNLSFQVTDVATAYFPNGIAQGTTLSVSFSTTNATPFTRTEPSDAFYTQADTGGPLPTNGRAPNAPTSPNYAPNLGTTNGIGAGPDFQLEAYASFTFNAGSTPAALGDFVWVDVNRNGQQDANEPGVDGVTVQLLDASGTTVVRTTTTGDNPNQAGTQQGYSQFTGLAPGTYVVQFSTGGGYDRFTVANTGPDATDSDANVATGKTGQYTLASGEFNTTVDAGLLPIDLELTKSVNNATPAVGTNVTFTVTITNNNTGPGVSTATGVTVTDILPAGLTFVSATPPGGTMYNSGTGIWTVGTLAPGASRTLTIVATVATGGTKTNFAQVTTANQIDTDSTPNNGTPPTPREDDEAAATLTPPAALGDFVWLDLNGNGQQDANEPGVDNVIVQLLDASGTTVVRTATTGDNPNQAGTQHGYYQFTGLAPGTYVVRFVAPGGFSFTTANVGSDDAIDSDANTAGVTSPVTLASGEFNRTIDAGLRTSETLGNEGGTPGFWKNNADKKGAVAWGPTGLSPDQKVSTVFAIPAGLPSYVGNQTLLDALSNGGGGVDALLRQAVAALLNARHPLVNYPLTSQQIISSVNAALASGNAATIEALKNQLDAYNNLFHPIDQQGRRI